MSGLLEHDYGYNIKVLNLLDLMLSDGFNALAYIEDEIDVEIMAKTIMANTNIEESNQSKSDPFWEDCEISILKAVIMYFKNHTDIDCSLVKVYEFLNSMSCSEIQECFDLLPRQSTAAKYYNIFNKAPENLKTHQDYKKDERFRLQAALELNQLLAMAYYMKERLRLLFQCVDRERANAELTNWIRQAQSSGLKILKDTARKLLAWKPFILNWHKHPISTGKLEATNRKIGTLQRNAYGYRDEVYLKLRIYNIHNSTYALTG
jgi:hypothetical protein